LASKVAIVSQTDNAYNFGSNEVKLCLSDGKLVLFYQKFA